MFVNIFFILNDLNILKVKLMEKTIENMKAKINESFHKRYENIIVMPKNELTIDTGFFDIIFSSDNEDLNNDNKKYYIEIMKKINEYVYLSYYFVQDNHYDVFDVSCMEVTENENEYIIKAIFNKHTQEEFREMLLRYYKR